MKKILLLIILLFLIPVLVSAQELPKGLQVIKEYNQQYAVEFLQTISIPLAFLAGILSIFSPCILPLIPAYFAYTFKEKRNITKMNSIFFSGFSLVFVAMGLVAAYLGQSFVMIQKDIGWLIVVVGFVFILFGLISFFGKGFSSFIKKRKTGNDTSGIFSMGIFFALGWSACLGPILAGVLLMAGVLGNFAYAAILMFVYSVGIFIPLIIISVLYDRYNFSQSRFVKGKMFSFNLSGKNIRLHSTNILSGALFIFIGLLFVLFQSTGIINQTAPFGPEYFYVFQKALLQLPLLNIVGIIGLIVLVLFGIRKFINFRKNKLNNKDIKR